MRLAPQVVIAIGTLIVASGAFAQGTPGQPKPRVWDNDQPKQFPNSVVAPPPAGAPRMKRKSDTDVDTVTPNTKTVTTPDGNKKTVIDRGSRR